MKAAVLSLAFLPVNCMKKIARKNYISSHGTRCCASFWIQTAIKRTRGLHVVFFFSYFVFFSPVLSFVALPSCRAIFFSARVLHLRGRTISRLFYLRTVRISFIYNGEPGKCSVYFFDGGYRGIGFTRRGISESCNYAAVEYSSQHPPASSFICCTSSYLYLPRPCFRAISFFHFLFSALVLLS